MDRAGNIVELVTTTTKVVPPDPTSAMFWLTNRVAGPLEVQTGACRRRRERGDSAWSCSPLLAQPPTAGRRRRRWGWLTWYGDRSRARLRSWPGSRTRPQ